MHLQSWSTLAAESVTSSRLLLIHLGNPKTEGLFLLRIFRLAFLFNRSDECAGADHAQKGNEHEHGNHNDERISESTETEGEGIKEGGPTGEGSQEINQDRESGTIEQTEGHQERARS